MGIKFTNNASATLAASINTTVTSISVTTGQGARFPTLMAGDYFFATLVDSSNNMEIIKVTNRVTDTMTIVRAQDGTIGRSFLANDRIELRPVAASFNALQEFTPSGTIAANTLSGAIVELDSEKAAINSPTFTGTPAAPTAAAGTNTTQLATTAFTTTAITNERSATTTLTNKTISGASNTLTVRLDQTDVINTLPVARGGTGQSNSYTDGQLLIGNSTGNTLAKATLTAGAGIGITNGAGSITIAYTGNTNIQTFNNPGTWTKPVNASPNAIVRIQVWGAGGGGGGLYGQVGAGGGGGAYNERWMILSELTATVSVTVGTGGTGSGGGNGGVGGTSTFGSYVTAYGGGGGQGDVSSVPGFGGGGGVLSAGGVATVGKGGGAGFWGGGNSGYWYMVSGGYFSYAVAVVATDSVFGGGGGAGRYYGDNTTAARGVSVYAGNGGTVGVAGSAPAGGGGATANGAAGRVVVTVF